jgi:hypothetical protein
MVVPGRKHWSLFWRDVEILPQLGDLLIILVAIWLSRRETTNEPCNNVGLEETKEMMDRRCCSDDSDDGIGLVMHVIAYVPVAPGTVGLPPLRDHMPPVATSHFALSYPGRKKLAGMIV